MGYPRVGSGGGFAGPGGGFSGPGDGFRLASLSKPKAPPGPAEPPPEPTRGLPTRGLVATKPCEVVRSYLMGT